jgi:hypothetical protein
MAMNTPYAIIYSTGPDVLTEAMSPKAALAGFEKEAA